MAATRQYLIPGQGYINENTKSQYLIPGWGYINAQSYTVVFGYCQYIFLKIGLLGG